MRDLRVDEGRSAFGRDAVNYDTARPDYPAWVFEHLRCRCKMAPGTAAFEIGPGTGHATSKLLELGAQPLVAIEPDVRLSAFLERRFAGRITVLNATFEDAQLSAASFGLGAAATSFHWMDQGTALIKVANALCTGGWWTAWWNVFGDPDRHDAFHEATRNLLQSLDNSPSQHAARPRPFALDHDARLGDIVATGAFENVSHEERRWTLRLTTAQVRALYSTFSQFSILETGERERLLDSLARIADVEFGGIVERNMCTVLYTAQKR